MIETELCQSMDAKVWTEEFLKLEPDSKDFGTMIAWFAAAIMAGYDNARWKYDPEYLKFNEELYEKNT